MNTELIKLFNVALVEPTNLSFAEVNNFSLSRGYIVHPDVCNESVIEFLDSVSINPNSTFYKDWQDITSKSRRELAFDQILHYASTYGTEFSLGNGYVPNDDDYSQVPSITSYKVILPISKEDLAKRCFDMLTAGIALKENTMHAVADFAIDFYGKKICIDDIRNREAMVYVCNKLDIFPSNPEMIVRMLVYLAANSTVVIKDKRSFDAIRANVDRGDIICRLSEDNIKSLSEVFYRYKPLILSFKSYNKKANSIINKIRRLAVKNHVPYKASFWQNILTEEKNLDDVKGRLSDITNFKKIAILRGCAERVFPESKQLYVIRNNKTFIRENYAPMKVSTSYLQNLYATIYDDLVKSLKNNAYKTVKIEENGEVVEREVPKVVKRYSSMNIPLPTSEKAFVGNYPFGTSFKLAGHNNFIGCYWRNEWGTRDYDLSMNSFDGTRIGWNAAYTNKNKNVVFSGDMTNANPEAAEVIGFTGGVEDGIISVNQFSGQENSKFQLFFGQKTAETPFFAERRGYMVDPNDIKIKVEISHSNQKLIQPAIVKNGELVLLDIRNAGGIVYHANKYQNAIIDALYNQTKFNCDAIKTLERAGFVIVDETYTGEVDIDFANVDKDTFISLLA